MADKNHLKTYSDTEFSEILKKAVEIYSKEKGSYDSTILKETLDEMDIPEEYIRKARETLKEEKRKKEKKRRTMRMGVIVSGIILIITGIVFFFLYRQSTPEQKLEQMRKLHYNNLVSLEEAVRARQAQLENVIDRKVALIPNLITLVREYAEYEHTILKTLKKAHADYINAGQLENKREYLDVINEQVSVFMEKAETLERIKADDLYQNLLFELAGSENRISVEKKRFNEAVADYNAYARTYPLNQYITDLGFAKELLYWQE